MKKKIIIAASAVVVVLAIVAVVLFAPKAKLDQKLIEENTFDGYAKAEYIDEELVLADEDFSLIGEAGNYQLYFNKSDYTLKVKNIATGYEWQSFIDETDYIHNADKGATENTLINKKKFKKIFELGYTDFAAINKTTSPLEYSGVEVNLLKLKNGVALETYFDMGIGLTMEIWVDKDGLNVRVPIEKVKEEGDYGVTSLSVLPMFGSMSDKWENSFLLFPDSTGGIYNIKPISKRQGPITSDLYFSRDFNLDDIQTNNQQGIKNALMPYFGIGKQQNGVIGYISEGEMNSCVTLRPSGAVYNINRIEPVINYRKSYRYLDPAGNEIIETEEKISAETFGVHYSFVTADEGKNVSYGDLANTLRKYLADTKRLVKTESAKNEGVNVNLQMLMSTKYESMIGEFLKVMTKCEDVENLVKGLDDDSQDNLRVLLLGWQSSGYNIYPSSGKAASGMGSIEDLSKFLTEKGIDSYLVDDYVLATTDSSYFSKEADAVYNEAKTPVTNTNGDQYVRNPYKEYLNIVNKVLPYYEKNSVCGVGFDKIGWYVFDDAKAGVAVNRFDTTVLYSTMLEKAHEAGFKTAVQRGNAYVLSKTDYLYDIPKVGSNISLIDRDVPFYQLVVHGYIPYSLDIPGNMSVDYTLEMLKWIEYGAEPTFLLTQKMSEEFKDSKVENAFSTEIETWADDVAAIIKEFNGKLAFTGNHEMVEHTLLGSNVYRVGYSNGYKIYINYNKSESAADSYTIPAESYVVVDANGSVIK